MKRLLSKAKEILNSPLQNTTLDEAVTMDLPITEQYVRNGRRPWSPGYIEFRQMEIRKALSDNSIMNIFKSSGQLPPEYGMYLDERMVEYPWLFSRICDKPGRVLDAGSILNYDYIITHPKLDNKQLSIITLAPEQYCFFQRTISYHFGDIREMPFRDEWFDEVISISTIEHIGMDNSIYTADGRFSENAQHDFLTAVLELKRITRKGGRIFLSVPYGKHIQYGYFQQFNAEMISKVMEVLAPDKTIETYFAYENDQWNISTREKCDNKEAFNIHDTKYFNKSSAKDYDHDFAACSRAIAALEIWI